MFNIGGWEVVFILLLVLLLWKPEELEDRARQLGRWWARLTHSPWWREMNQLRYRAEQFMRDAAREANLEEVQQTLQQQGRVLWPPEDEPRATRAWQPPPVHPDSTAAPPAPATQLEDDAAAAAARASAPTRPAATESVPPPTPSAESDQHP